MGEEYHIAEEFLDKYKQLESITQRKYSTAISKSGDTPIHFLEQHRDFVKYAQGLVSCRIIRNVIQHNQKLNGAFPIEPSAQMVDFLDEVIQRVQNRKKCTQAGVPFSKMYCRTIDDTVSPTIDKMRKETFTHVPIIEERKVIGIFDENSLFCYIAEEGIVDLEGLTFRDILDYISLDEREMEVFSFHSRKTYLDELRDEFQRQFDMNKRLGVAFITENGKRNESVTHMLTAWDVIGQEE